MATTNLNTKTLGDIKLQSGNGAPDHTALSGSIYSDVDNSELYIRIGSGWEKLYKVSYGEGYIDNNTTELSIASSNVWYANNVNLIEKISNGVSINTTDMVIDTNRGGDYKVIITATFENVTGINNMDLGISINSISPTQYSRITTDDTDSFNIVNIGFFSLSGGDTISIAVRNSNNANNIIISYLQIQIHKV